MGESAGGIAVSQLCASPLAKGLFQGAISESGGSFGPSRPVGMPGENMVLLADAERAGEAYAKTAGAASIEDLRKLPADKVLETSRGQQGLGWPIMDGWAIPDDQYRLYEAKRYNDTPILVGYGLWGLSALGYPADSLTEAMVWYLAATQRPDGSWPAADFRPPMEDGPIQGAAFAIRVLRLYPLAGREPELKQRIERARDYLSKAIAEPVNLIIPTNYNATVEALGNRSLDFAYLGALTYLKAHAGYRVLALVQRSVDEKFHSLFITPAASSLSS